jgi:glycosyltransferase involved in cell wall biosynthesis
VRLPQADRPSLLFLAQSLPYPPHSGVASRTFNVLKQLQKEFDVSLAAFSRRDHQASERDRASAQQSLQQSLTRVARPCVIPSEHSLTRRVWDQVRSVSSRRPYTDFEYDSDEFREAVLGLLGRKDTALIHLDSLDLHSWRSVLPDRPTACTHHSIESELLRLQAGQVRLSILAPYVRHQANLVERVERSVCPEVAINVMMSDLDARRLESLAPGSRTVVIPNGVDVDFFAPHQDSERVSGRLVFVGPTYSFPNRDAVDYLLDDIWGRVLAGQPGASLHLVGRNAPSDRARFERAPAVTCLGYVSDVRPHLAEATCCVVPIRAGGGTRLKILDAWAMGKAIVSTTIGCEGLDARHGENILIADDPSAFAQAVGEVLGNSKLRETLQVNARSTAVETYAWDTVGARMRAAYWGLLRNS